MNENKRPCPHNEIQPKTGVLFKILKNNEGYETHT